MLAAESRNHCPAWSSALAFSTSAGIVLVDIDGSPPLPWLNDARPVVSAQHGWAIVSVFAAAE